MRNHSIIPALFFDREPRCAIFKTHPNSGERRWAKERISW